MCYRLLCGVFTAALWCFTVCTLLCYLLHCDMLPSALWCVTVCTVMCYRLHCDMLPTALWCVTDCTVMCYRLHCDVLPAALWCVTGCTLVNCMTSNLESVLDLLLWSNICDHIKFPLLHLRLLNFKGIECIVSWLSDSSVYIQLRGERSISIFYRAWNKQLPRELNRTSFSRKSAKVRFYSRKTDGQSQPFTVTMSAIVFVLYNGQPFNLLQFSPSPVSRSNQQTVL
jgi:hypothetical protein